MALRYDVECSHYTKTAEARCGVFYKRYVAMLSFGCHWNAAECQFGLYKTPKGTAMARC